MKRRIKTGLNRRNFLAGVGATLALPWLESLAPRRAWAASPDLPPRRLLYYYTPNGFRMDAFTPVDTGPDYTLSPLLEPLAPHKQDMLVVSGLDNKPGNYNPDIDACCGAHFQQTAAWLTCAHIHKQPVYAGQSIDQVVANHYGYVTPYRSLQLAMKPGGLSGNCAGENWPCAYKDFVSWVNPTTPMITEVNPATLFANLFGGSSTGKSEADFNLRKARKLKVLDVVHADALALKAKLGSEDQQRLEQYLTAVNETENKVIASAFGLACDPGDPIVNSPLYTERLELMLDIITLAFQCDLTRVITFMTAPGGASMTAGYDWVTYEGKGITESFHTVSHHGNDPTKLGQIQAINAWELEVFSGLLTRLKLAAEGDGTTLLDNTIVFFSSECSDGASHSANNLPIILAGSGQGALKTGRHITYEAPANVYADLHIGLAQAYGVPVQTFGDDGTQPLSGLAG